MVEENGTRSRLDDAAREFWCLFEDAVRSRLMSDVPLGVFLSGGLDSSLIVAAMRECGVDRLATFSVGVGEVETSEIPAARKVAEAFSTDHHETAIGPRRFFETLPTLTQRYDFPVTFPASIPLYFVSEMAARSVKVVLTGEGCDELFAGYGRYPRALWNLKLGRVLDATVPDVLRSALARAMGRFGDGYVGSRIRRSFLVRRGTFEDAYLEAFAGFDDVHRAGLLKMNGIQGAYEGPVALLNRELLMRNPLEAMLRFDQGTYLQELLTKQDRMSMAASLESRVPYLDHALVEWAGRLPSQVKLRRSVGKSVVRAAARNHLPDGIIRAAKRGFPVPLDRWFRGDGREWLEQYAPEPSDDVLNGVYVRRLMDQHLRGADHSTRLWLVLAFQVWRHHVLGAARAETSADLSSGRLA
jgi:asparagine synthase (glutamine-hydrolysing)